MRHATYVVVAISLALCGCGEMQTKGGEIGPAATDKKIDVKIQNGKIVVPEDPAIALATHGSIKWTLSETERYTFPRDGIVIDPGNFSCRKPQANGKMFHCIKKGHVRGDFKYIVNVNDGTNPLDPLPLDPLDPWIFNR